MTRSRDVSAVQNNLGVAIPPAAAGKNAVINGGMDIWQRGTSAAGSYPTYLADRWMNYRSVAGSTFSRQNTNDTTNLPNIQYCQRIQRDSGNTSTADILISQSFENVNSKPFIGQTVTVSFYARAGANFSATSNNMFMNLYYGTGTDQNLIAGFTGQTLAFGGYKTLTSTWQRFTATGTVATSATQLGIMLGFTPVGTAGANDYFEVTGVQLELGSSATPFSRAGGTIQGELAACQRYYEKSYNPDVALGTNTAAGLINSIGSSNGGGNMIAYVPFKVTKRSNPTFTFYTETGTLGSWQYQRSGVGTTDAAASGFSIGTFGGSVSVGVGANWTNSWIFGHWTASAEL